MSGPCTQRGLHSLVARAGLHRRARASGLPCRRRRGRAWSPSPRLTRGTAPGRLLLRSHLRWSAVPNDRCEGGVTSRSARRSSAAGRTARLSCQAGAWPPSHRRGGRLSRRGPRVVRRGRQVVRRGRRRIRRGCHVVRRGRRLILDGRGVLVEPRVDPVVVAVAAGTERQEVGAEGPRGLHMPTATDHIHAGRQAACLLAERLGGRGVLLEPRVDPVVEAVAAGTERQEVAAEGPRGLPISTATDHLHAGRRAARLVAECLDGRGALLEPRVDPAVVERRWGRNGSQPVRHQGDDGCPKIFLGALVGVAASPVRLRMVGAVWCMRFFRHCWPRSPCMVGAVGHGRLRGHCRRRKRARVVQEQGSRRRQRP